MIDWFDPAFKAGGPIRSCVNFVAQLHNEFDIYVNRLLIIKCLIDYVADVVWCLIFHVI